MFRTFSDFLRHFLTIFEFAPTGNRTHTRVFTPKWPKTQVNAKFGPKTRRKKRKKTQKTQILWILKNAEKRKKRYLCSPPLGWKLGTARLTTDGAMALG